MSFGDTNMWIIRNKFNKPNWVCVCVFCKPTRPDVMNFMKFLQVWFLIKMFCLASLLCIFAICIFHIQYNGIITVNGWCYSKRSPPIASQSVFFTDSSFTNNKTAENHYLKTIYGNTDCYNCFVFFCCKKKLLA